MMHQDKGWLLDNKGCGGGSNGKIINEEREGVRVNYNELEKKGGAVNDPNHCYRKGVLDFKYWVYVER